MLKKLTLSEHVSIFTLRIHSPHSESISIWTDHLVTVGQSHPLEGLSTGYLNAHSLVIANLSAH